MSVTTEGGLDAGGTSDQFLRVALAGLVAAVVFGVIIQFVLERMTTIGALYTLGARASLSAGLPTWCTARCSPSSTSASCDWPGSTSTPPRR